MIRSSFFGLVADGVVEAAPQRPLADRERSAARATVLPRRPSRGSPASTSSSASPRGQVGARPARAAPGDGRLGEGDPLLEPAASRPQSAPSSGARRAARRRAVRGRCPPPPFLPLTYTPPFPSSPPPPLPPSHSRNVPPSLPAPLLFFFCVRIATWNVNSLKQRVPRLLPWLDERRPDVVCLQETKLAGRCVPRAGRRRAAAARLRGRRPRRGDLERRGDPLAGRARGRGAGIEGAPGFPHPEARAVSATCGGIRVVSVYVPNGRVPGSEHYQYKLAWLAALARWSPPARRRRSSAAT